MESYADNSSTANIWVLAEAKPDAWEQIQLTLSKEPPELIIQKQEVYKHDIIFVYGSNGNGFHGVGKVREVYAEGNGKKILLKYTFKHVSLQQFEHIIATDKHTNGKHHPAYVGNIMGTFHTLHEVYPHTISWWNILFKYMTGVNIDVLCDSLDKDGNEENSEKEHNGEVKEEQPDMSIQVEEDNKDKKVEEEEQDLDDFSEYSTEETKLIKQRLCRQREGQGTFIHALKEKYKDRVCFVTGSKLAVQAAHIEPHYICQCHKIDNGMFLSANWHFLFDFGEWTVKQADKKFKILLGERMLKEKTYKKYNDNFLGEAAGLAEVIATTIDANNFKQQHKLFINKYPKLFK